MLDAVIRRATKNDRDIYAQCLGNEDWRNLYGLSFSAQNYSSVLHSFAPVNSHELQCFICETKNGAVGFVNLLSQGEGDIVMAGGVLPQLRESGLGAVFYAHIIYYAMKLSTTKRIVVQVENNNSISKKMQQYFGFIEERNISSSTKKKFILTRKSFLDKIAIYQAVMEKYSCEVQDGQKTWQGSCYNQ